MDCEKLLNKISAEYNNILDDKLVGIYIHGSIAFGCFNWEKSDIDFIAVVNDELNMKEKEALIQVLLELEPIAPPKGFEMSVVHERFCKAFIYPTPYILHYSGLHRSRCTDNLEEYCRNMHGTDKDLAAHFTVIGKAGRVLCGKPIEKTFSPVPAAAYRDSIQADIMNARQDITESPISSLLNLCRVLAYARTGSVLSKQQGGMWVIQNSESKYAELIQKTLEAYATDEEAVFDESVLQDFCTFMLTQIFGE